MPPPNRKRSEAITLRVLPGFRKKLKGLARKLKVTVGELLELWIAEEEEIQRT